MAQEETNKRDEEQTEETLLDGENAPPSGDGDEIDDGCGRDTDPKNPIP
jgi:hypothetical protein